MKKPMAKGRRKEMKVSLAQITVDRWKELYAENDYAEIASKIKPPTTPVNVASYVKAAEKDINAKIPVSIAMGITNFYKAKAEIQDTIHAA